MSQINLWCLAERWYRMLHGLTRCSGCYVMLQGVSVIGFYTVLEGVTRCHR